MDNARSYLMINSKDNCAIALKDLKKGTMVSSSKQPILLQDNIPQGHKFALMDIAKGCNIIKYGYPIGAAIETINAGDHISDHNVKTNLNDIITYDYKPNLSIYFHVNPLPKYFMGYGRKDGNVGVRNDIFIIPLVGCVNNICRQAAEIFTQKYAAMLPQDTRIIPLEHPYGCSQLGDDLKNTRIILQNIALHPNAGAVLIIGLGCENNSLSHFLEPLSNQENPRLRYFNTQDVGDEIAHATSILEDLYGQIKQDKRTKQPFSKLKIGLKCGGSDGLSGITANPLLGQFSDDHCVQGGSAFLTEVPEMFGAEHILMNKAKDKIVFQKIVHLINDFKTYYKQNHQPIYENPSPGNKKGGISTLEEKSLGCIQKAGHSAVTDVLDYGQRSQHCGLQLLSAPGNDLVAITALAAAGCQIILFTTGRGTPLGTIVPTIKVSSGSKLIEKKSHWIDFDASPLLQKRGDIHQLSTQLGGYIHNIAEGSLTSHEKCKNFTIAIFKTGVTL